MMGMSGIAPDGGPGIPDGAGAAWNGGWFRDTRWGASRNKLVRAVHGACVEQSRIDSL